MPSVTIRATKQTRDLLRKLAQDSGTSIQDIVAQIVDDYWRGQVLEATNAAYAALQTDVAAWGDLSRERQEWDETLADGLEEL